MKNQRLVIDLVDKDYVRSSKLVEFSHAVLAMGLAFLIGMTSVFAMWKEQDRDDCMSMYPDSEYSVITGCKVIGG